MIKTCIRSAVIVLILCHNALADVDEGKRLFEGHCSACHGAKGHGDTPIGQALKVANIYSEILEHEHDNAHLIEEIMAGKGAMPAWKGKLSPAQAQNILDYIKMINEPGINHDRTSGKHD